MLWKTSLGVLYCMHTKLSGLACVYTRACTVDADSQSCYTQKEDPINRRLGSIKPVTFSTQVDRFPRKGLYVCIYIYNHIYNNYIYHNYIYNYCIINYIYIVGIWQHKTCKESGYRAPCCGKPWRTSPQLLISEAGQHHGPILPGCM